MGGGKWDKCHSIINKIYFFKKRTSMDAISLIQRLSTFFLSHSTHKLISKILCHTKNTFFANPTKHI